MTVTHDTDRQGFFAQTASGEAELTYVSGPDGVLDLQHTFVPEAERGRGVGESLVRAALDHARAHDLRVVPTCPFVRDWLAAHPEASDLVARA